MTVLVLGLVIFLGVHSFRALSPDARAAMIGRIGEGAYKGLYTLASIAGFVLIIWGFALASAEGDMLYVPASGLRHATEALMLPALVLAVASALPPGYIRRFVRHPQLVATIVWAIAHLLVNGETAAVVLFGAFLAWAVFDLAAQRNRPAVVRARPRPVYDAVAVVGGVVLYAALVWRLHLWAFGVSPLG